MIGLGSNRLTVCRRGGMSVTQAGRGGMEWLAGVRWPRWSTPYSAAATAALKAQFQTQWPTIRDYGFAHPALVPFINEDPMLVMSLIAGLGTRLVTTNNASWIDTGLSMPNGARLKAKVTILGANNHNVILGAHELSSPYKRNMVGFHNGTFWLGEGNSDYNGGSYSIGSTYEVDGTTKKGASTMSVNGTIVIATNTNTDDRSARNLYLFANNNTNSGASQFFNGRAEYAQVYDTSDVLLKHYVPYKNGTTDTMLDIVGLQVADLHGTLTISETPAS